MQIMLRKDYNYHTVLVNDILVVCLIVHIRIMYTLIDVDCTILNS